MKIGGTITASVKIKNTGARAGTEVAQLYIRDVYASAGPRPVRELKGFQKILLQPGESRDVTFTISEKNLVTTTQKETGWSSRENFNCGFPKIPLPASRRILS